MDFRRAGYRSRSQIFGTSTYLLAPRAPATMLVRSSALCRSLRPSASATSTSPRIRHATVLRGAGAYHAQQQQTLSGTPNWSRESMVAVREKYEAKYAERLKQKAKEQGLDDIKELKAKAIEQGRLKPRIQDLLARKAIQKRSNSDSSASTSSAAAATQKQNGTRAAAQQISSRSEKSPIKPLHEIVDLPKLLPLSKTEISTIWNGYHQLSKTVPTLSAVIPWDIYQKMEDFGRKYGSFVVPLPREVEAEDGVDGEKKMGSEMYFLQWSFIPSTPESGLPSASTVLYTPLALYKSQQTFAQPHLILTHYMDLVPSHGIVLMRGDVTPDVSTKIGDGQLLVLRLQQFYQGSNERRLRLLKNFHEKQEEFDIQDLVDSVGEV